MSYVCHAEGQFKAIGRDGHVTKLYCQGHIEDWKRHFPHARIVRPRKFPDDSESYPCQGDWMLPGEVP